MAVTFSRHAQDNLKILEIPKPPQMKSGHFQSETPSIVMLILLTYKG